MRSTGSLPNGGSTALVKVTQSVALFLFSISTALPLPGQERTVTLAEAISMAQRVQPTVVQARGALAVAGSDVRSAYSAFLPSLSGNAGAGQSFFPQTQSRLDPLTGELITGTSSNKSVNFGVDPDHSREPPPARHRHRLGQPVRGCCPGHDGGCRSRHGGRADRVACAPTRRETDATRGLSRSGLDRGWGPALRLDRRR